MSAATNTTVAARRRLRPRFTLRLPLVAITAVCMGLAIWTHRAREQRSVVERIEKAGGTVNYDFERYGAPRRPRRILSYVPKWLREWAGQDCFHDVTNVMIFDPSVLDDLRRFRRLEVLQIANQELTDDQLAPVVRLHGLIALQIVTDEEPPGATQIGDRSLAAIATLPNLEHTEIEGARITAKGLESLAQSSSLQTLYVRCYDASVDKHSGKPFQSVGRLQNLHIRRYAADGWGEVVVKW